MNEKLLRVSQVSEKLSCHASHVYALIGAGKLPATRTGEKKGIRVSEEDLNKFIKMRRIKQVK